MDLLLQGKGVDRLVQVAVMRPKERTEAPFDHRASLSVAAQGIDQFHHRMGSMVKVRV